MSQPTSTPTQSQVPTNGPTARAVTVPRPAVAQTTLAEILKKRRDVKQAEKSLKALKHELSVREEAVIKALEGGATITQGILTASVNHEERRNVPWRKVAEQYLGEDFCQLVADETPPTVYPRLLIT